MMRGIGGLLLALVWLLGGCRKEEPPKAVAVRADGVLELCLCSFNIRNEGVQDQGWKSWPNRLDRVTKAVREIDPDVLGVQEAFHGQIADLWASLPGYGFYGLGRDDGKRAGEYAGIYWKSDRFEADPGDRGTFWLSDTPEIPGSRTWGNSVVRVAAWVRLSDRATGRGFYVFNTHWDHRSQPSRERAALLIAERIDGRRHQDEPVVLLGDFNATGGNPAVDYFKGKEVSLSGRGEGPWKGAFRDPYQDLHPDVRDRRTLHFWKGHRDGWAKVDHILVSSGASISDAGIYRAESRETQPSDHFPVWARLSWD